MDIHKQLEQIRLNLSCAYLEANDLILRLEDNKGVLKELGLRQEAKQAANLYINSSKKLINELEKLSNTISDTSKEDDEDNYRKLLNQLPKGLQRLDIALKKIIKNEK